MSFDWIETYTGRRFHLGDPKVEVICIEDIAHALSLLCRFGGHCRVFYSVAQHSVLVSENLPSKYALHGLLHDASEAYLVDVPRPIKPLLTNYRMLEERLTREIYKWARIEYPDPPLVRAADSLLLRTERRDLMGETEHLWPVDDLEPLKETIDPWSWQKAEWEFLDRFKRLCRYGRSTRK